MKSVIEQVRDQEANELKKVLDYFGSVGALAKFLEVSFYTANQWRIRGRISATAAAELEKRSNSRFKKAELRPDIKDWFDEK